MTLALPESIRLLLPHGTVKQVLLEDYLRGVVAAALPADAPLEAMKALAIAARTFAAHTHRHLELGADVCTARHCQAWSERANPRAARAVLETRSTVAVFDEQFVEAFYFEHCDGKTRDARGVLMHAPAYLKSVTCPCGFASLKGHGIGMCQRGMLVMARLGETSDYILKHYYTGISLVRLEINASTQTPDAAERVESEQTFRRPAAQAPQAMPAPPREPKAPPAVRRTGPPRRSYRQVAGIPAAGKPADEKPAADKQAVDESLPTETSAASDRPGTADTTAAPPVEAPLQAQTSAAVPEQTLAQETPAPAAPVAPEKQEPPAAPAEPAAVAPETFVPLRTADKPQAEEADDFLSFLAVEEETPPGSMGAAPGAAQKSETLPAPSGEPPAAIPPAAFAGPPPSMPEELPGGPGMAEAEPPPGMPEELPTALELEFIARPSSVPEDLLGAPPPDLIGPPARIIEPNLEEFIPPVERFYTPLDAPPSMPEELPSFESAHADDTPFAWVPPPPLHEAPERVSGPKILIDALPGPRIIAGNLPGPGVIVTIRDANGNSVVTVSGGAKQYGSGGFEAPLTEDGTFKVKFNGTELDVKIADESVFIYYG